MHTNLLGKTVTFTTAIYAQAESDTKESQVRRLQYDVCATICAVFMRGDQIMVLVSWDDGGDFETLALDATLRLVRDGR